MIHSSHLIEHVESPSAYLRKTWDLLAPGGLSVFITPNTATWEARAFGRHWGGLHAPRHWALLDEAQRPAARRPRRLRAPGHLLLDQRHVLDLDVPFAPERPYPGVGERRRLSVRLPVRQQYALERGAHRRVFAGGRGERRAHAALVQHAGDSAQARRRSAQAADVMDAVFPIDELRRLSRVSNARADARRRRDLGRHRGGARRSGRPWGRGGRTRRPRSSSAADRRRWRTSRTTRGTASVSLPRPLNNWVGAWLYAYPVGIPFHYDRRRHLAHHKRVGLHDDPDWVNYSNAGRETPVRLIAFLAGRLLGTLLVSTIWSVLVRRRPRVAFADGGRDVPPRGEWLRMAACQAVLAVVATFWLGIWAYPLLWLLPLSTVTAFCTVVRAFVEHNTEDDTAPVDKRLRDYAPGPLEAAWFSPCHFHFHALHHAYPSIPHYRLPDSESRRGRHGPVSVCRRSGVSAVARRAPAAAPGAAAVGARVVTDATGDRPRAAPERRRRLRLLRQLALGADPQPDAR